MGRLSVRIQRVVEKTHEEAFSAVSIVRGGVEQTCNTALAHASKEFEFDKAPVCFTLGEGEPLPEELRISVRGRLGHSGQPEVLGYGTVDLRQALSDGQRKQTVRVPLSRHHKRNMESEPVITEHTGDADVEIELEG